MAYRDDSEALKERYESLTRTLEDVRSQARALSNEEAALAKELDDLRVHVEGQRRRLPMSNVRIATPCTASWDEMVGDERSRFCGECQKPVHDLTRMSRDEVDAFLFAHSGGACVRLYQRSDGRVITGDCPVGVRRRKAQALVATMFSAGACAVLSLTAIARVMTSEIAPYDMREATPIYVPVEGTSAEAPAPYLQQPGFIWVEAQEGTRIFEGDRFVGTAPMMFPASPGTHAIRAIQRRTGVEHTALAVVHERWVATVVVDFEAAELKSEPVIEQGLVFPGADDTTNPL
jgi:hypothetical protein